MPETKTSDDLTTTEPPVGSVLLLHGSTGTAYQRLYRDGMYYAAGSAHGLTYEDLLANAGPQGVIVLHEPKQVPL